MCRYFLVAILLVFANTSLAAEEKKGYFDFNKDRFLAGITTVQDSEGVDDLFMAGETVRSEKNIAGSAHLAGRKVISKGDIGGDAYLAGMDVSLDGKVIGDATISGYNVQVGEVTGDLRVSGANLTISGPVAGYALIAGDEVRFESIIIGDVSLTAREVSFADGAKIEGKLIVYEKQSGKLDIPSQVVPADRIDRRDISEWSQATREIDVWDWRRALTKFLVGVIVVAGIAALIAAIVPQRLADLRRDILARPVRTLWIGLLAQSVIVGSTIILMMTLVGLLLAPATLLIALVSAFAGYIVAAYAFGVGLLMIIRKEEPESIGSKVVAAGVGALAVGLIGLIPFFGWLFVLALALTGVGAIAAWLFKPKFFASA